jgi:outer membrane usher protein
MVRSPLAIGLACALLGAASTAMAGGVASAGGAGPKEVAFNSAFLMGESVDLSRFSHGNPVDPGTYLLEVMVNGKLVERRNVTFRASEATPHQAQPCMTVELLEKAGVKPELLADYGAESECLDLSSVVPHATVSYEVQTLRLNLSIPQAALVSSVSGAINPALWDQGITAGLLNYSANVQRTDRGQTAYAGLTAGFNLGAWRLRHRGSLRHSDLGTDYQAIESNLQRDLPGWRSQLFIGESNTGGELFDSQSFTGVRLASDERMLPDALRGYAPVVRGNADTDAKVTIRQNGYVIHEISVAPGPFVIDNLYPTAHSGDLEVTVTEADGREQRFNVSFSAVPQALREGTSRYSVAAGKLRRPQDDGEELDFLQATYARGVNNYLTLLTGTELSQGYQAGLLGAAVNTPMGAFGADLTYASSDVLGTRLTGNSLRMNYQRNISETGTHFGLAAYRYSTNGYLTLGELVRLREGRFEDIGAGLQQLGRAKHRLQLDFSQSAGERSSLFVRGGYSRYWTNLAPQSDYQFGFQSSLRNVNYSLSLMRTRDAQGQTDDRVMLGLNLPLGKAPRSPYMNASVQGGGRQGTSSQASIHGTRGERGEMSYNLGASEAQGNTAYHAGLQYRAPVATLGLGYGHGAGGNTLSANASGALVAHAGGINFGPSLSESFVLVEAQGAQGARVGSGQVLVGGNGYALLPNATPYRWNDVSLDPHGLSMDVEMLETSKRVVPTAGAAVKVSFETRVDTTVFVRVTDENGVPLSQFGESVRDEDGAVVGMVSQGGVIQVRGHERGRLTVEGQQPCVFNYQAPAVADAQGLRWTSAVCNAAMLADSDEQETAAGVSE